MSLLDEILPYIDGNGLVSPSRVPPGVIRASDNGPLFSSQLIHMIEDRSPSQQEMSSILYPIKRCIDENGYLHRAPDDITFGNPDNHYGVLSVGFVLKLPSACWHPALIYMNELNKGNLFIRILSPLIALIIAMSNLFDEPEETSNRLLTWTLIQGVKNKSVLCNLAGKIWYWRINKLYADGLRGLASIYYEQGHPFVRYIK